MIARCSIRSRRRRTATSSRERHDTDFAYEIAGPGALPRQHLHGPQGPGRACSASSRRKILTAEQLGLSPAHPQALPAEQGAGARHRADRLRQVDDALRDDRPHQPDAHRSHHHDRGPDRVRAREQEVPDQPARGAARTPTSFKDALRAALREDPGHRPGRRDARPRDGRDRHRDGGDRPPRVRHAAHDDRGVDRRPHHRPVPGRPAGADPRHAVGVAEGRHRADAVQEDRRRPRRRRSRC